MKNFLLGINILLLALVGYLYYLHFHNDKNISQQKTTASSQTNADNSKSKVAYIDLDSLQSNYGYYQKLKEDFERKQSQANDEIAAMQKKYQSRAMQLQQKAQP